MSNNESPAVTEAVSHIAAEDEPVPSWIDAPEEEAGGILVRYAHALEARLEGRLKNWEIYAAVFSEQLETSLRPSRQRYLAQPSNARNANLTFNVCRSMVETEHATVTEAQPRPTIQTEDGNGPQQELATELQFAIDGVFSDLRAYPTFEQAELDKGVFGTGVIKTHHVAGRPAIDRVLIPEILVDEELLGSARDPKQVIHRMELARRDVYRAMQRADVSKEALQAIEDAPPIVLSSAQAGKRSDLICVYDAYSLPIDKDDPGRHTMAVENYEPAIFTEEWKSPRLPFEFLFWQRPAKGFYGIGIIERQLGKQIEINRFYRNISKALTRWGGVTCLLPTDGKIDQQLWTNAPEGKFIPFQPAGGAGAPVFLNGPKLSPEDLAWLQLQIENAYRDEGIPQNVAFAQREQGIPSAQGQRELSQKAAARLAPHSKSYERAIVGVAWRLCDVLRELKEQGEELVISAPFQGALHVVDIEKALKLQPGTFHVDIYSGNLLSRHPAARREEVQEYAKAGIFDKDEVRALARGADVDAAIGKPVDVKGIYQRQIKAALSDGTYTRPEEFWPALDLGKKLYSEALFEAQATKADKGRLQVLRDWLIACKDITDKMAAEQAPQEPTPQGAPQGGQMPRTHRKRRPRK